MSMRKTILEDVISRNKNEESTLFNKKWQVSIQRYTRNVYYVLSAGVPFTFFMYITKRHTGRTVYKNLFLLNISLSFLMGLNYKKHTENLKVSFAKDYATPKFLDNLHCAILDK